MSWVIHLCNTPWVNHKGPKSTRSKFNQLYCCVPCPPIQFNDISAWPKSVFVETGALYKNLYCFSSFSDWHLRPSKRSDFPFLNTTCPSLLRKMKEEVDVIIVFLERLGICWVLTMKTWPFSQRFMIFFVYVFIISPPTFIDVCYVVFLGKGFIIEWDIIG